MLRRNVVVVARQYRVLGQQAPRPAGGEVGLEIDHDVARLRVAQLTMRTAEQHVHMLVDHVELAPAVERDRDAHFLHLRVEAHRAGRRIGEHGERKAIAAGRRHVSQAGVECPAR
jgi:hypothetical protein